MNGDSQSRKAAQPVKLLIAVQLSPPESVATDRSLCPYGRAPSIVAQLPRVVKPTALILSTAYRCPTV